MRRKRRSKKKRGEKKNERQRRSERRQRDKRTKPARGTGCVSFSLLPLSSFLSANCKCFHLALFPLSVLFLSFLLKSPFFFSFFLRASVAPRCSAFNDATAVRFVRLAAGSRQEVKEANQEIGARKSRAPVLNIENRLFFFFA